MTLASPEHVKSFLIIIWHHSLSLKLAVLYSGPHADQTGTQSSRHLVLSNIPVNIFFLVCHIIPNF